MGLYTIYDELAKQAAPVFWAGSDELAMRQFDIQRPQIPAAVLRDLRVYRLCQFDMRTMEITDCKPVLIDESVLLDEHKE